MLRDFNTLLPRVGVLLFCWVGHAGLAGAQDEAGTAEPVPPLAQLAVDAVFGRDADPMGEANPRSEHHPTRLLVRFKPNSTPGGRLAAHTAAQTQRVLSESRCVDGLYTVEVPEHQFQAALAAYQSDPTVLYAEPDYCLRIAGPPNDPKFDRLWGLHNQGQSVEGFFCYPTGTVGADIRAVEAWDVWAGDPDFRVAVIDTGVDYEHPDLAANMWTNPGEIPGNGIDDDGNGWIDDVYGYDFHNADGDPMDDHRHGSHVAGTIGAVGNNELGVVGVNHHCSIVALKTFDANGRGFTSSAVWAMEYVIESGIRVSNNSWGCSSEDTDCYSQALFDVIQASQAVGHIFVAAAGNDFGNDNDEIPFYPVGYDLPNIIGVAATDNRDNLAIFSNLGAQTVDIGAPGTCIYSTLLDSGYGYLDGTSMATPHVTGVVALVMSRLPGLSWEQVRTRIFRTARPLPALAGITVSGGVVDAAAAVWDCNGNGTLDEQDIADGISDDCNANLLPDECEPDCNGNNIADECDIISGTSPDCAGNGIPDECEPDCNDNGSPDSCDIADGISTDCADARNGIPDECEPDCDGNGHADSCDIGQGAPDCNHNSVPDTCEPGGALDCNNNGIADLCDIFVRKSRDCNQNAVPDECDTASGASEDCTHNGVPDECESDCNGNGIADSCDIADGTSVDCSGNRIPDECEPDCNVNGVADICDIRDGDSSDCNLNKVPDECEPGGTAKEDCDNNGKPDLCDIFDGSSKDCNSNYVLDNCDIAGGFEDVNGDGVPDVCEGKGFRLVPVGADGPHTINENEIVLPEGDQTVTLEVRISGWDLDQDGDPRLRGYQAEIDASGFTSGLYGALSLARIPCDGSDDCAGWQSECDQTGLCDEYSAVTIDLSRPDFVYVDLISVWVVNLITQAPNFLIMSALFNQDDAVVDPDVEKYAATILLHVPALVGGTFTVSFEPKGTLFGSQYVTEITIPSFSSALITIPSDCNDNGVVDDQDITSGTSTDCNGNGIPDDCLHIEPDCNGNQSPDDCDIAGGLSQDCAGEGIPDECEPDCNVNGFADSCDLADGISDDVNVNGVPDECEPRETVYVDTQNCFFPGSGSEADPYCSLQFAINSCGDGRQAIIDILVADGVYRGLGNKNLDFDGRALTLHSMNGPAECVIDAEGEGRAFVFRKGDDAVYVSGFTMSNCSATSGGAIYCSSSNPTITDCVITDNTVERFGGAMYLSRCNPILENCTIRGNTSQFFYGGGIYCYQSNPTLANCIITDNRAELGAGIFCSSSAPAIRNSTLAHNTGQLRGGGIYAVGSASQITLTNSIMWANDARFGPQAYLSAGARLTLAYCDLGGGPSAIVGGASSLVWLEGNFDGDPRFHDPDAGDYHLLPMSPCINWGDPDFVPQVGETDTDGQARVLLGNVDVGADEAETFADCDEDGIPDGRKIAQGAGADCNHNEVLDECDISAGGSLDELPPEGDGIPDECQFDCNGNDVPDDLDVESGSSGDCNSNDIPDECDIAGNVSQDCDSDGVPDECEIFGDVNHNGVVNVFDLFCVINAFGQVFTECTFEDVDIAGCESDGVVDILDLFAVLDGFGGINACCP